MSENLKTDIDSIVIKVAETDIEKREVYQLRYQVFALELDDQRYADHELKEFKDTDDINGSILIIAKFENRVIGSVRLKPLKFLNFIGVENYGFEKLAEFLEVETDQLLPVLAAVDRFCFAKDFRRGSKLCRRLLDGLESHAASLGLSVIIAAVDLKDKRLCNFYERFLGYKEYPVVGTQDETQFQCFYGLLNGNSGGSDVRD